MCSVPMELWFGEPLPRNMVIPLTMPLARPFLDNRHYSGSPAGRVALITSPFDPAPKG